MREKDRGASEQATTENDKKHTSGLLGGNCLCFHCLFFFECMRVFVIVLGSEQRDDEYIDICITYTHTHERNHKVDI